MDKTDYFGLVDKPKSKISVNMKLNFTEKVEIKKSVNNFVQTKETLLRQSQIKDLKNKLYTLNKTGQIESDKLTESYIQARRNELLNSRSLIRDLCS